MAAALSRQTDLRTELGEALYREALAQVAAFAESKDKECREALRILSDDVSRPQATVGLITIDGRDEDWSGIIPTLESRRWPVATEDRARKVWRHGAAAVVRRDRLIAMLGLSDAGSLDWSDTRVRFRIDCAAGPEWDVDLFVWLEERQWRGQARYRDVGYRAGRTPSDVRVLRVAVKDVLELELDTRAFAPSDVAKPIWTLYPNVRTQKGKKTYRPRTRDIPVINEDAKPGVAADVGARMLMLLAADVGLRPDDRTAAAIAITSATVFASSNAEVRRHLRRDNAEHLRFARKVVRQQRRSGTDFRLDKYPLEAQLAWANRCIWLGVKYLGWRVSRDAPGDLESYRWAYTPIDTLRELNDLVRREKLVKTEASETAATVDGWVTAHLHPRLYWGHVLEGRERYKGDPQRRRKFDTAYERIKPLRDAGKTRVGTFKGRDVHQVFARNTEIYLRLIGEHGCFYGGCPDEAWLSQDMLRAAGLAPLAFYAGTTHPDRIGHCWAGYFNPVSRRWRSAQVGRSDEHPWILNMDRIAVYPYAATAARADGTQDRLPYPQFMRRRMIGRDVARMTQKGIPTAEIRAWMLAPWFSH